MLKAGEFYVNSPKSFYPNSSIPIIPDKELLTPPLSSITVTDEMVLKKLEKLDPSKSYGPDELHPRVLKEAATAIAPALTILFNNELIHSEWTFLVKPNQISGSTSTAYLDDGIAGYVQQFILTVT